MKDDVSRLTPLAVMVLALLREDDMHPYEMKRLLLQRRDDRLVSITHGTLYHTVARLQRAGLLDEVGVDREGNRPERTTYTLTPAGDGAVTEWVRRELPRADRPEQFRVALAEAHNLPRDEVASLLRDRRETLAAQHAELTGARDGAAHRGVPEQFLVEVERHSAMLAADLTWLDALLLRLDDGGIAWGVHEIPASHVAHYQAQRKAARS